MKRLLSCIAVALTLIQASAWADCVDGSRSRTTEELEFGHKLSASLKAAMPAAPAPLWLEREPEVILGSSVCKDTPVGAIEAIVTASYTASLNYSDRVQLVVRANFNYPKKDDLVLGTLPTKPVGFKVQNLVLTVDGYNKQYIESVKQAIDRTRLQAMIDQPLPATPAPAAWRVGNAQAPAGASAAVPTPTESSAAGTPSPTPEPAPAQTDVARQTKDAVKKLRGLLGQ